MEIYRIKDYEIGKPIFECKISWTDVTGIEHSVNYDDPDSAETLIGLLTGNIKLGDLEP